ncbi:hypothetical protein ABZX85_26695 [Streptomyces sp. NPDC004539]|uniref:hypothetical protein n=1 Tax=Streptomyces sp. NPDC004539 TaxID=3154280 RepID=UPI0033A9EA56
MAENGGEETAGPVRPSRLRDYLDPPPGNPQSSQGGLGPVSGTEFGKTADAAAELPPPPPSAPPQNASEPAEAARRREFAALLGGFRRTPVLLPLAEGGAPLVADFGGIRWIYAFSNEEALSRFAIARGEIQREWPYRRVLGARLLDVGTVVAGVPCGVALDVGSDGEGVLFPPVRGIVPDGAAVDSGTAADMGTDGEGRR